MKFRRPVDFEVGLLGHLQRCKPCASTPLKAASTDLIALKEHAKISAPAIMASDGEFGRGLVFKGDCRKGTVVSIPLKNVLLITDDPVESQSLVGVLSSLSGTLCTFVRVLATEFAETSTSQACVNRGPTYTTTSGMSW